MSPFILYVDTEPESLLLFITTAAIANRNTDPAAAAPIIAVFVFPEVSFGVLGVVGILVPSIRLDRRNQK